MSNKYTIKDWVGNECFNNATFKSFDDAEAFLQETLEHEYDTDRQEYEIVEL